MVGNQLPNYSLCRMRREGNAKNDKEVNTKIHACSFATRMFVRNKNTQHHTKPAHTQ
jgi:hypothetical protein